MDVHAWACTALHADRGEMYFHCISAQADFGASELKGRVASTYKHSLAHVVYQSNVVAEQGSFS